MSQRKFKSDCYIVTGGWDKQLEYHFLTVEKPDGTVIWSNLDQDDYNVTPAKQLELLGSMGIVPPETWVQDLIADMSNPNGSFKHDYGRVVVV